MRLAGEQGGAVTHPLGRGGEDEQEEEGEQQPEPGHLAALGYSYWPNTTN